MAACGVAALIAGDWRATRYLLLYVAPLIAFAPWWAFDRSTGYRELSRAQLATDVTVALLAAVRLLVGSGVPVSGHALLLTHATITLNHRTYRYSALALLVVTTWFKVVIWDDPRTLIAGVALGCASGGA